MNLEGRAREEWGIKTLNYPITARQSRECLRAYAGHPDWEDEDEGIISINFAKAICSEIARLTMIGTKLTVDGSRKDYLQNIIDKNYYNFRKWMEYACASGTVILKPNGTDVEIVMQNDFIITETYNGEVWGAIFLTREISGDGKLYYTRMEYHRFEGEGDNKRYLISNRVYVGESRDSAEERIDISESPWSMLDEEATVDGLERPLFAVLSTPQANNVETDCPISQSVFYNAMQELMDLDIAYSRNAEEINDSRRTILMDSDRFFSDGGSLRDKTTRIGALDSARASMGLPKMVKAIEGEGQGNIYTEINPTLNTSVRIEGINTLLSQIGYKIGFANGYFVFNQHTGIQTATGVEADQQRTIQLIKDCRDKLEKAIEDLLYALNAFANLYNLASGTDYEVTFDFGDITYNREEDRARWWTYVQMGKVPFWYYLNKFEGFSEEDAKELENQAQEAGLEQMMKQQQMMAE